MTSRPEDLYRLLDELRISYQRVDHPPVFTCEEADRLVPPMEAARTKNLFLTDKKGRRHFLVVVGYEKRVDVKALSKAIEVPGMRLASDRRLMDHLGVEPGSVTLLAVMNDRERSVEVLLDEDIWCAASVRCHPLVNTATLAIAHADLERFLAATGHAPPRVLVVPGSQVETGPAAC